MTTVILIAILIVLLILACTFGLLRRSGKKDRQQRDQFNDVMTSIAASNADPSIPLSAEAAAMLQQQYPYILADQQIMDQQMMQQQQQQQQQQHPGYLMSPTGDPGNQSGGYSLRNMTGSPRHHHHSTASSMHASPAHHSPNSPAHLQQQQQQQHSSSGSRHPHHHPSPRHSPAHFAATAAALDPRFMPAPIISMDRAAVACGSAEAEFQNDFIEVFPMQHLEPKPDLN